jgi:SAM-dependent methyltransferase
VSIFPDYIRALERENDYRPITGDVLLIGRQKIENSEMTDIELFRQFPGVTSIRALDVSQADGAEIRWDLNEPVPSHIWNTCDFLFDGSCLDNIFNPAEAVRSFSRMLRPNGRMMIAEHGTAIQGALIVFSPEWFFDFFAANDYADCQITLFSFPGMTGHNWTAHTWDAYVNDIPVSATPMIGDFVSLVIAEKGWQSTNHQLPVQAQYRDEDSRYLLAHKRFGESRRRVLK